jgi:teichuronic acid biosynthesis glycosyltransferase TuaC
MPTLLRPPSGLECYTSRDLKIVVVTPYFPVPADTHRGHSAYQTLLFLKEKADVEVICPLASYPRTKWLSPWSHRYHHPDLTYRPEGVKTTYFEYPALPLVSRPFNGLVCARRLEPYLSAMRPDVILNYWIYPEGFSAARIARKLGIPVIVGAIGSDLRVPGDPITFRLTLRTLQAADAILTVSEELRRRAIELGVPAAKVTTILNGCDFSIFRPGDRAAARRKLGVDPAAELLLYVGWISPTKGIAELTDAMISLAATHPRLRVTLIGEGGAYRSVVEARAAAGGIAERFLFLGLQPSGQVADWLRAADLFCLPSHSEGCPNVIVEAIACGRPVVATNVGGIPELVDESCGILVPPHDSRALAEALERALATSWDPSRIAAHLGRGWETVADETYELCCRVLRDRQATMPPAA